jgi:hypothetical protein
MKRKQPKPQDVWYRDPEMRLKVKTIQKDFGEPFLITKEGVLLYEHCIVIPAFRGQEADNTTDRFFERLFDE